MTTDRTDVILGRPLGGQPLRGPAMGGGTYRGGVSIGPAGAAAPLRPAGWRRPAARTVGLGVAGALALGLAFGFWAKPNLGGTGTATPMQPVTAAQAAKMDIEVAPPVLPSPVPRAPGKLEVLPPGAASVAPAAPRPVSFDARLTAPAPQTTGADPACANAGGRAAQMVCADPDLADADRELNRAYRRALRSGVPTDQLRDEQRDWLAIREEAARRSPRAVARIYEQRIDELNQIAEDGPG